MNPDIETILEHSIEYAQDLIEGTLEFYFSLAFSCVLVISHLFITTYYFKMCLKMWFMQGLCIGELILCLPYSFLKVIIIFVAPSFTHVVAKEGALREEYEIERKKVGLLGYLPQFICCF